MPKGKQQVSKRQVSSMIKKQLNNAIELKRQIHYVAAGVSVTAASSMIDIFNPTTGLTDSSRVGDSVRLASYAMNFVLSADVANTAAQACRIIIFQWNDDTTPAQSDILESTLGSGNVTMVYKHDNLLNGKLHVLEDRLVTLSGTNDMKCKALRFTGSKALRKNVQFINGGTGGTNKVWLYYQSDQIANYPQLVYDTLINFRDA